jgi:hypothetical protein
MKHLLSFFTLKRTALLFILAELISFSMSANPGDTTWVTVFNNRKITQYGNYDTVATFPTSLTYRKIRLHYILGRYACPAGSQYCGSWDYTTQIHARPAGLDSVEIARVITPYASTWPLTKKLDYIIDVTDYATVLQGITSMRYKYDGYSWGFTLTLKIEFIEGTPPMTALTVKNIYDGYFPYGITANPIENYLVPKTFSYTSPVTKAVVKNSVSGHGGSDNQGCSEFCNKYYQLLINNSQVAQKQIWRNNCGVNDVYDQSGTWVFDRSNWCPGAVVWPIYHDLSGTVNANSTFSVNVDMEPYVSSQQNGPQGYNFVSQLIGYGPVNYATDVAIEDIIAPTKDLIHFRSNPTCNNAVIKIKNTGSSPVSSVMLSYGLAGYAPDTYTWTGLLNSMEETEVSMMPAAPMFTNAVDANFSVTIVSVNGSGPDQNLFNDTYRSVAPPTTIYPSDFVVRLFTNNATDPNTQANETSWTLYDAFDNVIASRTGTNSNNTVYRDTLSLLPGCYRFKVEDSGCDGFAWWFYPNYPVNPGNGTLRFDNTNAFTTLVNFTGDVGCGFTKYLTVLAPNNPVGISSFVSSNVVEVYPNPASETAYIKLDLNSTQDAFYRISDVKGRLIAQKSLSKVVASYEKVDLGGLSNGVYIVSVQLGNGEIFTKKLVVQK